MLNISSVHGMMKKKNADDQKKFGQFKGDGEEGREHIVLFE